MNQNQNQNHQNPAPHSPAPSSNADRDRAGSLHFNQKGHADRGGLASHGQTGNGKHSGNPGLERQTGESGHSDRGTEKAGRAGQDTSRPH